MNHIDNEPPIPLIAHRFRGFLPVIIDVETSGFDPEKNALLEIAAVPIIVDQEGFMTPGATTACHVDWRYAR